LVDVEETMKLVLEQEDTDGNFQVSRRLKPILKNVADALPCSQIAATDKGPKVFSLGTASSNGYNSFDVS
jgi:alpha,alpha-trehalase